MTVSIMMVSYNRLELTKKTLESLFETTKCKYRLLIVDNGSTDGTLEYLKSLEPPTKYCKNYDLLLNTENKGISIGRNQALLMANKYEDKYLATIDNDVIMPNGWLQKCMDIMAINPNYSIGVNFESIKYPLITLKNKTFQFKDKGNLGTAGMVFPRTLHNIIGFFRDYNLKYSCEDSNWSFRGRMAGYQFGYLEEMGIHIGEGEADTGEYRIFKDECHKQALKPFQQDCYDYMAKRKPIYIPFEYDISSTIKIR
jgi:GT2 family glycosyltransferase